MIKKIALALAALVGVLLLVIATRPSTFRIERSIQTAASHSVLFSMVNDFHHWPKWSPWEKLDPAMKKEFSGAPRGTGAIYSWTGNDDVGEGRMTITESQPYQRVGIQLEFLKPFTATNQTTFVLSPARGGTAITWAMEGTNDFMGKAFSLFMDMDATVGKDFESGLTSLKTLAENETRRLADLAKEKATQAANEADAQKVANEAAAVVGSPLQ